MRERDGTAEMLPSDGGAMEWRGRANNRKATFGAKVPDIYRGGDACNYVNHIPHYQ